MFIRKRIFTFYIPEEAVQHLFREPDKQICSKLNEHPCEPQKPVLAIVKRRKLSWFGLVTHHNTFKTILTEQWTTNTNVCSTGKKN